jgi:hypothetical protein
MFIMYGTKNSRSGTVIEVKYSDDELEKYDSLKKELESLQCVETKIGSLPIGFKPKDIPRHSSYFNRSDSMFGFKTEAELQKLIKDTFPILKKYDPIMSKIVFLFNEND